MNLDLETIFKGLGILGGFVAMGAVMKWRLDSYGNQLEKLWNWKDKHEEEAGVERLRIYQGLSKLEGILEAKSKENLEIMRRLEHIDANIVEMKEDLAELRVLRRREQ